MARPGLEPDPRLEAEVGPRFEPGESGWRDPDSNPIRGWRPRSVPGSSPVSLDGETRTRTRSEAGGRGRSPVRARGVWMARPGLEPDPRLEAEVGPRFEPGESGWRDPDSNPIRGWR